MKKLLLLFSLSLVLLAGCEGDRPNSIVYSKTFVDCKIENARTTGGKYPEYYMTYIAGEDKKEVETSENIYKDFKALDEAYRLTEIDKKSEKFDITFLDGKIVSVTLSKNRK